MEQWALQYQLTNASPEYVFDWLKNNQIEVQGIQPDRKELETSLLARNKNLINLGLALFGAVPAVGYTLFRTGDETIKKAALSGSSIKSDDYSNDCWVLNEDVLPELIKTWNDDLLNALFNNHFIDDEILIALFKRIEPYDSLDDESWVRIVAKTIHNDRLSTPYAKSGVNGLAETRYDRVFDSAWHLFGKFSRTSMEMQILEVIAEKLVAYKPSDMDVMEVIKSWRVDEGHKDSKLCAIVREALVKTFGSYSAEFKELKNSDDIALRRGYYSHMERIRLKDVEEGFKKDAEDFVESALYNKWMYKKEDVRDALREACGDVPYDNRSYDYLDTFDAFSDRWAARNPDWFLKSWSEDQPFESIKDLEKRNEKRLEYLSSQVSQIQKSLHGDNGIANELKSKLQAISLHLKENSQASSLSLKWTMAGFVILIIASQF